MLYKMTGLLQAFKVFSSVAAVSQLNSEQKSTLYSYTQGYPETGVFIMITDIIVLKCLIMRACV